MQILHKALQPAAPVQSNAPRLNANALIWLSLVK
jgi:hypothetical protein